MLAANYKRVNMHTNLVGSFRPTIALLKYNYIMMMPWRMAKDTYSHLIHQLNEISLDLIDLSSHVLPQLTINDGIPHSRDLCWGASYTDKQLV